MVRDYYNILQIPENANSTDIKAAFRIQALKWHPDKNPDTDTTSQMQAINEAFLILKDEQARKRYDKEYQAYKAFKAAFQESNSSQNYEVKDEKLARWMNNAKEQSIELAKQSIEDFKGVMTEASKGLLDGLITAIMYMAVGGLFYALAKSCS